MKWKRKRSSKQIYVQTRDHWHLATYRYWTKDNPSPWDPVILVHGFGVNRHNFLPQDANASLAYYLQERGHDVWVVELRGAGRSRAPGWPLRQCAPYLFEDYLNYDVPALMRRIIDETGSTGVHWVGHSMGGMLAYAACAHYNQRLFKTIVTIGSPGFLGVKNCHIDKLYACRKLLMSFPYIPNPIVGGIASLFPAFVSNLLGEIMVNVEHMEVKQIAYLSRYALHTLPAPLVAQFIDWYGNEQGFRRMDGLLDYVEQLDRITVPILMLAGAGDQLISLDDLRHVFRQIGSSEKKFLIMGKEYGNQVDYGHIDLLLGKHARAEVFPRISDWIEHFG